MAKHCQTASRAKDDYSSDVKGLVYHARRRKEMVQVRDIMSRRENVG